jgi:hypothetical protein
MIAQCSNDECRKPLLHLDNGRVIRTIKHLDNATEIQHFWLCGDCYVSFDFSVTYDGDVSCLRREGPLFVQKEYYSGPKVRTLNALAG